MADGAIKDFFIELGFDPSAFDKGLAKIQKDLSKLKIPSLVTKNSISSVTKLSKETAELNSLENKRLAYLKQIYQYEKLGGDTKGLHNKRRIKDPNKLDRASRELAEKILQQQRKITQEKQRQSAIDAAAREASKLALAQSREQAKLSKDLAREQSRQAANAAKEQARLVREQAKLAKEAAKEQARIDRERVKESNRQSALAAKEQARLANIRAREELRYGQLILQNNNRQDKLAARNLRVRNQIDATDSRAVSGMSHTGGTVELKHYQTLKAEVEALFRVQNKTAQQWEELRGKMGQLNTATSALTRRNRELSRSMTASQFSTKALKDSLNNLARSYLSVFAVMSGGRAIVDTGQQLVGLRNAVLGVSGDSVQAAKDFQFVQDESMRLGVSLKEATESYGKLGTAAKMAGLTQQQTQEVFSATAELATAFNLTSADYAGVSRAMSQIMAKGKVSTEELLQIAERVPIAFDSAAKALGVSNKELYKQIETGKIQSVDFAPNVVKEWRNFVRESGMLRKQLESSRASMGRFGTAFQKGILKIMDSGLEKGLYKFFDSLTISVEQLTPMFESAGIVLGKLVEGAGILIRVLTQMYRPIQMFFNTILMQGGKTGTMFNHITKLLRNFISLLILPFAYMEQFNDYIEGLDGSLKMLASGGMAAVNAALMMMFLRMLGITKLISPLMSVGKWLFKKGGSVVGGATTGGLTKFVKGSGYATAGLAAYDAYDALTDDSLSGVEKGKRVTQSGATLGGALAGAKAGALAGTVFGPVGTAIGGLIGGGIGAGTAYWGSGKLYDYAAGTNNRPSTLPVSKSTNTNIGNINFTINGAQDPKAVVDEAMKQFNAQITSAAVNY